MPNCGTATSSRSFRQLPAAADPARVSDLVHVPLPLLRAMQAWVEPAWPGEGCGLLIGARGPEGARITRIVEARNLAREAGTDRFEIDPRVYLAAERGLQPGEVMLGFFHSHPDCPEVPSETDRRFAEGWPGFVWLILRVEQGTSAGMRAWRLRTDAGGFDELRLRYDTTPS